MRLLSSTNGNPAKEIGYLPYRLELLPSEARCPNRTDGCARYCNAWTSPSRLEWREGNANLFEDRPERFRDYLRTDIERVMAACRGKGYAAAVQLNAFSDVDWIKFMGESFFHDYSSVVFWDWTRVAERIPAPVANYHLGLSLDAADWHEHAEIIGPIAIVVRDDHAKAELLSRGTVYQDGDACSLPFLLPKGSIVLYTAKGYARNDETGFVL